MDVWMACEKDTNIISGNGILKIAISNTLLFKFFSYYAHS